MERIVDKHKYSQMKISAYLAPEVEILGIDPHNEICHGSPGSLSYGSQGNPGSDIENDNYVDGGAF